MCYRIIFAVTVLYIGFTHIIKSVSTDSLEFEQASHGSNINFTNCDGPRVPLFVKNLSFSPHPVRFGDDLQLTFDVKLDKDIGDNGKNLEVDISFRIKTKDGFMELCDIIGETECHYNDFCSELKRINCPTFMESICLCPFKKGEYNIPSLPIKLHKLEFEVRGTFEMTINILEEGLLLGCVEFRFCITDCDPLDPELNKDRTASMFATP